MMSGKYITGTSYVFKIWFCHHYMGRENFTHSWSTLIMHYCCDNLLPDHQQEAALMIFHPTHCPEQSPSNWFLFLQTKNQFQGTRNRSAKSADQELTRALTLWKNATEIYK